ncbi:MAG: hypothetical protein Q9203_006917 [Teloschistes exilis]
MLPAVALNHLDQTFPSHSDTKNGGTHLDYREASAQTFENVFSDLLAQLIECQRPLKEMVRELQQKHSPTVRLMITSRQIALSQDLLAAAIPLDICAPDEDIRIYTQYRISNDNRSSRFVSKATDLEDLIVTTVLGNARDDDNNHPSEKKPPVMFLLAKLQIYTIANKISVKAIRKALESLPAKLDELYHKAMERIRRQPEDERLLAKKTLIWVVHTYRPLAFATIRHALAVEQGTKHFDPENLSDSDLILNACAGLVVFEIESDSLRLVHYTAQAYFKSHPVLPYPHREIVKICVTYLSYDIFQIPHDQDEITLLRYHWFGVSHFHLHDLHLLLDYASFFWGVHAAEDGDSDTHELVMDFLVQSPKVTLRRIKSYGYASLANTYFVSNSGFAMAALFGPNRAMEKLRLGLKDINSLGYEGLSALHLAASNGKAETITLISWGAKVNLLVAGKSPLLMAIITNYEAAIFTLLENGADPNEQSPGHIPLKEAAAHCDVLVIDALIAHGAQIYVPDPTRTSLHSSIFRGRTDVTRRLLEMGRNAELSKHKSDWSPLHTAVLSGNVDCVELLLSHYVPARVRGGSQTPLHLAAQDDFLACAKMLIQNGADIEAKDQYGKTLLVSQVPLLVTITHDDVETLQRFPTAHKDHLNRSVVDWTGGMTALDYAEYLGDDGTMAEMLRPYTKIRTERLTMSLRDYMNKYHPGHTYYDSNNGYEVLYDENLGSLDVVLKAKEGSLYAMR